ncbi:MAG: AAA family ATPase [Anaerolineae bacterium]|jgi:replicative DNA helicase|nr:AAA family ATPase [Anaerolineae bacterium]
MLTERITTPIQAPWERETTGPATLNEVISEVEAEVASGGSDRLRPMPTGFNPLDDVLTGGLRPGELLVIGGAFGVGKTIWGLQVARNVVQADRNTTAMYICYEHDRAHLLSRLLCLESAEAGFRDDALTLRKIGDLSLNAPKGVGLVSRLQRTPRYATLVDTLHAYGDRLTLVKASGDASTLTEIRRWVESAVAKGARRMLVVVDYLQKIPVDYRTLEAETEVTTFLTQGLKELAMASHVSVVAIAASDRPGLKARRMRLSDLRGSSALQYEADIGLILNNKYSIVSREHMVYNPSQAGEMRNWVVMSVEKNRAGRNAVDMEFLLDAPHFRMLTQGDFVRERLVDEKVILE